MLQEKLKEYTVILASKSPRRQQFFKDLGIDFKIELKEVEEIYPKALQEREITDFLAELKSNAYRNLNKKDILITSDTIVWLKNTALGKPKNETEAFAMLKSLSGKTHQVITSVCIRSASYTNTINDSTTVTFKDLSDEEITYYIKNFNPYDKAGGYGIQEWIGFIGIEKIEGSYFNVVGLPVHKVYEEFLKVTNANVITNC